MKKKLLILFLMAALVMMFSFTGCAKSEEGSAAEPASSASAEEETPAGAAYGYAGEDPVELAAYKYMVEEETKNYDKADVSIPTVTIFHEDLTDPEDVAVYGDFWIENYNIEGDTLKCVSGGNYSGIMHMTPDGDNYIVKSFDVVADGADFDASARELFGEHYEDFMKVYSDSEARAELRKITISDYVNMNGLEVTKFQDEGWDPIDLILQ